MTTRQYCSEWVYAGMGTGGSCGKPVKAVEDGKPWCAIHLPSVKRQRQARNEARWAAKSAIRSKFYERSALREAAIAALRAAPPEQRAALVEHLIARDDALTAEYESLKKEEVP